MILNIIQSVRASLNWISS